MVPLAPRRYTLILCVAMVSMGIATKIILEAANASPGAIDVNSLVNFALIGFGGVIGLKVNWPAPGWLTGSIAQVTILAFLFYVANVGRISYGAYLIHNFLHFSFLVNLLQHFGVGPAPRYIQVSVELAASLVIASLSWRYLEKPIIAWAARVTSSRPDQSADSVRSHGPP